ncbi:hypothetical protein D9615_002920 [Tricholomella constricta]|uniref:Uncharacterized protein n=1 Tax=Tricholomella constricta TaxID=117010 RepID=A0A8H5HG46_9AGAR|nr:hypothetical protein D9615_002920 [Tricholomella constricta]
MPTSTNPSGLLAESLAALSKSAYQAFAEVENQARQDVAQATTDAREARLERDRALEVLHSAQLEGQGWQKEVANVKAALKQAEISISHHKETIAQLRREATQWKDQSRNWQEHFLRVEQERCSLTTRIEELVAERLQCTPFTPHQPTVDLIDSAPLSSENQTSASSPNQPPAYMSAFPVSPPDVDSTSTSISAHKPNRTQTKPSKVNKHKDFLPARPISAIELERSGTQTPRKRKTSPRSPTRHISRSTVVRRVQAVIRVKQEESDDESGSLEPEDNTELDVTTTKTKRPLHRTQRVVPDGDEHVTGDDSDYAPISSDHSYEDEGEQGQLDEEDDELMLGGKENHRETYNSRVNSLKNASHSAGESLSSSPRKKRKFTGPKGRDQPSARRTFRP